MIGPYNESRDGCFGVDRNGYVDVDVEGFIEVDNTEEEEEGGPTKRNVFDRDLRRHVAATNHSECSTARVARDSADGDKVDILNKHQRVSFAEKKKT